MSYHPFRVLSERGASLREIEALLAPDVTFHTPFLTRSITGREPTLQILGKAFSHVGFPKYTLELTNKQQTVLLWDGTVQGHKIQGVVIIAENADGLIQEISLFLRSYPVVSLLREAMRESSMLPEDFWELTPHNS